MSFFVQVLAIAASGVQAQPSDASITDRVPEILLDAERMRLRPFNGRIEWKRTITTSSGQELESSFTTLFAETDFLLEDYGDRDGVQMGSRMGQPLACVTRKHLQIGGQQWKHDGGVGVAIAKNPQRYHPVMDIRCVGLTPQLQHGAATGHVIEDLVKRAKLVEWHMTGSGDTVEIVGMRKGADQFHVVWKLDLHRDLNPIRVAAYSKGKLLVESRSMLKKIDGIWFPSVVNEHAKRGFGGDECYVIREARFNQADLPRKLGPAHLGLPPGMQVAMEGEQLPMFWTGETLVGYTEWLSVHQKRVDQTERRRLLAEFGEGGTLGAYPQWYDDPKMGLGDNGPRTPELWEDYVRRFGLRHGLDEKQESAAQAILKDAQKAGRAALGRMERALEEARAEPAVGEPAAKDAGDSLAGQGAQATNRSAAELLRPVEEEFARLQRRLDGLLTEAQKEAAAKKAAVQPATAAAAGKP